MSKQISPEELAKIVTDLLTNPDATGALDEAKTFSSFMTQIAQTVCDHCGGEVLAPASRFADDKWYVAIIGNDSLPEDGGIFAEYDKEGELFPVDDEAED